jgi:hypothetical protein
MSTSAESRSAGQIVLLVIGSLLALVAAACLLGGAAALLANVLRDDDGFFTSPSERFASTTYAITHEPVQLSETPQWVFDDLAVGDVRITAESEQPVFIGIADEADVDRYLSGVAYDEVRELDYRPFSVEYDGSPGGAPRGAPTSERFWVASAAGSGTTSLDWKLEQGDWRAVVMNADGSRGVTAELEFGADTPLLWWIGGALLGLGLLVGGAAAAMIALGARTPALAAAGSPAVPAATTVVEEEAPYPVRADGSLDPGLSRWLWLVKWFLAIPHYVVLAFLWAAFAVLTLVAFFAILFTGRYPRGIFDFTTGVVRWTWRVYFYAFALGTDRYPPFSLGAEPGYPATLEIPYPARLSRGLVLVKWWLLAIPHYLVLAILFGNVGWVAADWEVRAPSLAGVLALIAGVVLLVKGRYPREIFDLVVGCYRWAYRVLAYAALMRDEYPPFRLGR